MIIQYADEWEASLSPGASDFHSIYLIIFIIDIEV